MEEYNLPRHETDIEQIHSLGFVGFLELESEKLLIDPARANIGYQLEDGEFVLQSISSEKWEILKDKFDKVTAEFGSDYWINYEFGPGWTMKPILVNQEIFLDKVVIEGNVFPREMKSDKEGQQMLDYLGFIGELVGQDGKDIHINPEIPNWIYKRSNKVYLPDGSIHIFDGGYMRGQVYELVKISNEEWVELKKLYDMYTELFGERVWRIKGNFNKHGEYVIVEN